MAQSRPAGTPIWVDLATNDVAAAKKFYTELMGWEVEEIPGPDGKPMYYMLKKDGKYASGMTDLPDKSSPVGWNSYIQSDDVAADVEKVTNAGGKVMVDTTEVPNMGTFAVCADSQGAVFSLWKGAQGGDAADDYNKPGFLSWNELAAKDIKQAHVFYKVVFGWEAEITETPKMPYTEFKLNGQTIGGGYQITDDMPPMPPHWMVYFAVADVKATQAKVEELGGKVVSGPITVQPGTFTINQDPQGGYFATIELAK